MSQENSTALAVGAAADHWHQGLGNNQRKALQLLGQGVSPIMVASTLGITEGAVSQYLAEPRFALEVQKLKLAILQRQTGIDNKYMEAEERLVDKLLKTVPLMTKPMDILRGIQVINATKRRGLADGAGTTLGSQVVQITLPGQFAAKFVTDGKNQIVEIEHDSGTRSLVTASASSLDQLAAEVIRSAEETPGVGWERSTSPELLLQQASARIAEQGVSETIPAGLRRSLEAKAKITANDL